MNIVYVAVQGEDRILTFAMDPGTGKLRPQGETAAAGGPAPLAVDPGHRFLHAGLRSGKQMASFRVDPATGGLSRVGTISLDADPCYIATDRTGRFLLSAYYGAGKVAVHAIHEDGTLSGTPVDTHATAEHAHCIQADASNRFAFVPHTVKPNAIYQFRFDEGTGKLTPNPVPRVTPDGPDGPRHFEMHPTRDVFYVSNEQGCSVTAYHFDRSTGTLKAFQTLSTLPEGWDGKNTCAQIHIAPSGKFLYVSNRGHHSIACYSTDEATGRLTSQGQQVTEPTPRAFNVDPTGNFLFAAGLDSGRLAAYRIHPATGRLTPLETYEVGKTPMWVLPVAFPGGK